MRHVALIVPARDAELLLRADEDVVPEARLEVALHLGQVEVGARPAGERLLARCGRRRGRSRRGRPGPARRRRCMCRSTRCQPRGRTSRTAVFSLSAYFLPVSGAVNVIVRRTASPRLICPSTRLSQVGLLASSKSAMKTLAPELSALMTILRSVGPVISTRRSSRSSGRGATVQSRARTLAVSARKSGRSPASNRAWRSRRRASSSFTRGRNVRARSARNASAS